MVTAELLSGFCLYLLSITCKKKSRPIKIAPTDKIKKYNKDFLGIFYLFLITKVKLIMVKMIVKILVRRVFTKMIPNLLHLKYSSPKTTK